MSDTLVINLFGGPGVSKSTNAALLFGKLKTLGVNAEIASEYAKDLVWEGRSHALKFQPYIIAKQMYRVHRLMGQVEVVITDSPILLGMIYGKENHAGWEEWIIDTFWEWNTLNFRLVRNTDAHPFNPRGRTQTQEEAEGIDERVGTMLRRLGIPHQTVQVEEGGATADLLLAHTLTRLGIRNG